VRAVCDIGRPRVTAPASAPIVRPTASGSLVRTPLILLVPWYAVEQWEHLRGRGRELQSAVVSTVSMTDCVASTSTFMGISMGMGWKTGGGAATA
jgi:hypothetical protein